MSTSDPHRPGGATDRPDETDPSIEQTTPASDDAAAHEVAPTVETLDPPPATEPTEHTEPEPTVPPAAPGTTPVAARAGTTGEPVEPAPDTGRHAVVRPAPTPPDEPTPDPVVGAAVPATTPVETTPATSAGPTTAPAAPAAPAAFAATTPAASEDQRLFPDPNAPRSTTVGSHVLGILVGVVLAPIAALVLMLGEARILNAQVSGWDASTDVLGIVLVTLGVLLLGAVLVLALWTPSVPITAGVVLVLAGAIYLYLPSIAREQTLNVLSSSGWRLTVTQVTVAGTSGIVLAVGFLLLVGGLVAASARRRGARLGEFRERHRA
jgi:hypothetical protein